MFVREILVPLFQQYGGNSLTRVYEAADRLAKEMDDEVRIAAQTAAVELDLFFGPPGTIRPTRLGNIIAALDAYPFRRYRIEGTIFWPYLQQVMTGSVVEDIRDQRTLLDLGLALGTIFALLGLSALLGGPWLWWKPAFWLPLGLFASLFASGSYFVATQAALGMSRAMRAGCDLFRLEALHKLYRRHPATINEERALWQQVGQLAAYGAYDRDFDLRPRETAE